MNNQHNIHLIAKTVWIDFSRRKDFFVLLSILVLYAIWALTERVIGIKDESTSRLLLSCGLGLASLLSAVLVALFAARSLPEEFEARTLYPLLAKPVSRTQLLWAKFWGVYSIGLVALLLFLALAWLPVPKAPSMNPGLLIQAILLQGVALAILAWMAIWLSVRLPATLCALLVLLVDLCGQPVLAALANAAEIHSATAGHAASYAISIVPDFSALSYFQAYVNGAPAIGISTFLALALYGVAFAAFFALLSAIAFVRRPL